MKRNASHANWGTWPEMFWVEVRLKIVKKYTKDDTTGKTMLSFTLRGSDSIIVADITTRIVAGTGITNRAHIAPAANPIVPSNVLLLFQGNLCFP